MSTGLTFCNAGMEPVLGHRLGCSDRVLVVHRSRRLKLKKALLPGCVAALVETPFGSAPWWWPDGSVPSPRRSTGTAAGWDGSQSAQDTRARQQYTPRYASAPRWQHGDSVAALVAAPFGGAPWWSHGRDSTATLVETPFGGAPWWWPDRSAGSRGAGGQRTGRQDGERSRRLR